MHWILKLILHLFFWCTYFLFSGIISFELEKGLDFIYKYIWIYLGNTVWALAVFYSHYFLLWKIIYSRRFLTYLFASVGISILVSVVFWALYFYILVGNRHLMQYADFWTSLAGTFIIGNCGSLLKGFISWVNESNRKSELEKQTLKVELELLRSQLNHHFLFNTLNNIDTLIFKNPQKASDALISLSSILRYMLYDANTEKVPLDNELKNIENIIYLEQLRVSTPNYTNVKIDGAISSKMVPPLLFVSFVENAYKHSKFIGKLPVIEINIYSENEKLIFTCTNTTDYLQKVTKKPGNIGLGNIKRRLDLIYGNSCKFEITKKESTFKVYLEIPCN